MKIEASTNTQNILPFPWPFNASATIFQSCFNLEVCSVNPLVFSEHTLNSDLNKQPQQITLIMRPSREPCPPYPAFLTMSLIDSSSWPSDSWCNFIPVNLASAFLAALACGAPEILNSWSLLHGAPPGYTNWGSLCWREVPHSTRGSWQTQADQSRQDPLPSHHCSGRLFSTHSTLLKFHPLDETLL